jgi:hypothetical protein
VQGGSGGVLTVVFAATDPQLRGAEIRFTFQSSAGQVLTGQTQLWTDEGDPNRLAAFWSGNQRDLSQSIGAEGAEPPEVSQVKFIFEVQAPPPSPEEKL